MRRCRYWRWWQSTASAWTTFAELVDGCTDKYMKFGLEGGKLVILDRLQANEDAPRILQQHAITFDRSADLRCLSWCGNSTR